MTREEQICQRIQRQLAAMGPVLPGSLSEQWNVCGTPGCRCKARSNPKKHGRSVSADLYAYNIAAHVIFYTPTPTGILVIRVLHKSMDHVRHLA